MTSFRPPFKQAPLPFAGQKRFFLQPFRELIQSLPATTTFVDLFGGSGLLSRACKDLHPSARVVYNDFDNYAERLAHMDETERLRRAIFPLAIDANKHRRCHNADAIIDVVERHLDATGYVDWITLSVWILFYNNFAHSIEELRATRLYNSVPSTPLPIKRAAHYLDGIEVVRGDWREILSRHREAPEALFLFDPPYLATNCDGYLGRFWGLSEYIELLAAMPNDRYIYFTSSKLDFVPLLQRLAPNSPFSGAGYYQRSSRCGDGRNIEAMYYKL